MSPFAIRALQAALAWFEFPELQTLAIPLDEYLIRDRSYFGN